jgi:periplasmic divalent cation tolerance protein
LKKGGFLADQDMITIISAKAASSDRMISIPQSDDCRGSLRRPPRAGEALTADRRTFRDPENESELTMGQACVVMTTAPGKEAAEKLAWAVLEARLAACVQIQEITSYYWWDGKINREPEQLLYFKTTSNRYQALEALIVANHSYDTPEILQLPVEAGSKNYLDWMQKEVG